MSRVVIANDHGAIELKERIIKHLEKKGFEINDLGIKPDESADYPDMAELACKEYLKGGYDFGILLCGTGIGISISANKIRGIRCALPQNSFAATMAREHNNVDFLAFGGRIEYTDPVESMLDSFIGSRFAEGRHSRRVEKIMNLES